MGPGKRVILEVDGDLTLKQFVPWDAIPLYALIQRNPAHLGRYGEPLARKYNTRRAVLERIVRPAPRLLEFGIWAGHELAGAVSITPDAELKSAEIGIYLGEEFTGRGYATRATRRIALYGLEENAFHEIWATVDRLNAPSIAVLNRAGFIHDESKSTPRDLYFSMNAPYKDAT